MENVDYQEIEEFQGETKLPTFLKVLCILSFIYIGINLFTGIKGLISGPLSEIELNKMVEVSNSFLPNGLNKIQKAEAAEMMYQKLKIKNDKTYLDSTVTLWIYSLGFFGVLKMFKKRQKGGYYLYLVYSALSVFSIFLIYPSSLITLEDIGMLFLISSIMVALYTVNLKHLTN